MKIFEISGVLKFYVKTRLIRKQAQIVVANFSKIASLAKKKIENIPFVLSTLIAKIAYISTIFTTLGVQTRDFKIFPKIFILFEKPR